MMAPGWTDSALPPHRLLTDCSPTAHRQCAVSSAPNRACDTARHPFETLRTFGLRPGQTVVEIAPGGGWYSEILAPYLGARAAGFELAARSEVNANPRDSKDHPNGVWSLPPTLRGGAADRDRFLAIGESARMTLRFVKPMR